MISGSRRGSSCVGAVIPPRAGRLVRHLLKLVALSVGPPFGEQSAFMDDLDVQIDDPAESFRNKVGDAVDHATAAAPSDQDHVGDVLEERELHDVLHVRGKVAGSMVRTCARSPRPVSVAVWTSSPAWRRREATPPRAQPPDQPPDTRTKTLIDPPSDQGRVSSLLCHRPRREAETEGHARSRLAA
jgi:hypothetical protein